MYHDLCHISRQVRTGLDPSRHLEFRVRGLVAIACPSKKTGMVYISSEDRISHILMFYHVLSMFTLVFPFNTPFWTILGNPYLDGSILRLLLRLCRLPSLQPSVHDERLKRLAQEAWHVQFSGFPCDPTQFSKSIFLCLFILLCFFLPRSQQMILD